MLVLPIKKKWFDMIISGEKLEEYREIKPYYTTRFTNLFGDLNDGETTRNHRVIKLQNGYGYCSPFAIVEVTVREDFGVKEWGAEPLELYYVLTIRKIIAVETY